MRKLFPVLIAVFSVAAVMVFSAQAQAGRWHHGAGHGWHRGWSGGHGWHRGVGRWRSGWGRWYPRVVPGPVIVDDWADCEVVKRCFADRYGYLHCRWVTICP